MYLVIYECNASVKQTLRSKRETNFEVFIKYILIVTQVQIFLGRGGAGSFWIKSERAQKLHPEERGWKELAQHMQSPACSESDRV